jgi:7,8-dihydropterin-6-yl-methyl-4-(beta-D-ribofuranosyl)aminobenzene 5'-phosphate synthase
MREKYNRREFIGLAVAGLATFVSCKKSKDMSSGDKVVIKNQILNIYDNISEEGNEAIPDWGFSAFIQYNGKTILFDAGTHPDILEHNAKMLGADLTAVDIAVLSHNHIDHIDGFDYLLKVNPDFKLFLPHDVSLGADYYESDKKYTRGYRYRHPNTEFVNEHTEIAPGVFLIATTSPLTGRFWKYPPYDNEPLFVEMPELSIALEGEDGYLSIISGCSHSKIEEIVKATKNYLSKNVSLVAGGFHHLPYSNEYIYSISTMMKDEFGVKRVAPTHCTGEKSINIFKDLYKENFHYFGLGAKLSV